MNNFWCCDHDCASIAAHSSENLTQKCFYAFISKLSPPHPKKRLNLASNCDFASSWKSIYWKRWSTFDSTIRIMCQLLQIYVWNLTQGFCSLQHFLQNFTHIFQWKRPYLQHLAILFLDLKNIEVIKYFILGLHALFLTKCHFSLLKIPLFINMSCPF